MPSCKYKQQWTFQIFWGLFLGNIILMNTYKHFFHRARHLIIFIKENSFSFYKNSTYNIDSKNPQRSELSPNKNDVHIYRVINISCIFIPVFMLLLLVDDSVFKKKNASKA